MTGSAHRGDVDLTAFVPLFVRQQIALNPSTRGPRAERLSAAVVIADLSGFSSLAERFGRRGTRGAEELKDLLNLFFGRLVDEVHDHGGQILKFPGDAVLALWPTEGDDVSSAARLAGCCALAAQKNLLNVRTSDGVQLELRVGIGVGELWTVIVGGVADRWELLVAGDALTQAVRSLGAAIAGDVVGSSAMWKQIASYASAIPRAGGNVRLQS